MVLGISDIFISWSPVKKLLLVSEHNRWGNRCRTFEKMPKVLELALYWEFAQSAEIWTLVQDCPSSETLLPTTMSACLTKKVLFIQILVEIEGIEVPQEAFQFWDSWFLFCFVFFALVCGVQSTLFIFFIFFLFAVDFVIHWNETAMGLHVFPISIPPPTSLSTRSL